MGPGVWRASIRIALRWWVVGVVFVVGAHIVGLVAAVYVDGWDEAMIPDLLIDAIAIVLIGAIFLVIAFVISYRRDAKGQALAPFCDDIDALLDHARRYDSSKHTNHEAWYEREWEPRRQELLQRCEACILSKYGKKVVPLFRHPDPMIMPDRPHPANNEHAKALDDLYTKQRMLRRLAKHGRRMLDD